MLSPSMATSSTLTSKSAPEFPPSTLHPSHQWLTLESLHIPQQGHLGAVLNQKLPRLEKSRPSRLGAPGTTGALPGSSALPGQVKLLIPTVISVSTVHCYLLLACYLPATAWIGIVYLSCSLHLGTIEQQDSCFQLFYVYLFAARNTTDC